MRALLLLVLLFLHTLINSVNATLTISNTRVIYNAGTGGSLVTVFNTESGPLLLVQSWVSRKDFTENEVPLIATPPLFRLEANQQNIIRIERISAIKDTDREVWFWLNVNAIPAQHKKKHSHINFSLLNRIKLFYRPKSIQNQVQGYYKKLHFQYTNNQLVIKNTTPFHINFYDFLIDDKVQPHLGELEPFAEKRVAYPNKPKQVAWTVVNDHGGITEKQASYL